MEGFVQGIDKVIDVLGANAQTNGGWIDVGLLQFLGTHLRMGSRSGMDDKALHISNICQQGEDAQMIDEAPCFVLSAFDLESEDRTGTIGEQATLGCLER